MKYKKIILGVALALACFSSQNANALTETKVKKTEAQSAAPNVYWTDGYGRVSYTTNSIISPVVKIALKEFAGDMKAVTGFEAKEKNGAPIQIYQLDQLTNKEFSAVEKLGAPLHLIITGKDAFYIGTRKKKVIVIGSNARGTAYAIMKLSELAGVSPLMAWNDLKPAQRKTLYTPVDQQWIEVPRIEFRGLALNNSQWMKPQNYSRIARLMLRLRANTLWQVDGKHEAAYNKAVVDSFDICVAENYKVTEFVGKKHKKLDRELVYVQPVKLTDVHGIDVLESKTVVYYVFKGAALVNVVADLAENRAYPSWKDGSIVDDMTNFTMECMVNFNKFGRQISTIMGIEGNYLLRVGDSGVPDNQLQVACSRNLTSSDLQFDTNKWYHVAVTFDNGEVKVYYNGVQKFSGNCGVSSISLGAAHTNESDGSRCFWIGYSYASDRYLDGKISEVRIWNKTLTAEEINAPAHFYTVDPESEGLVAYWKFDEGSGTVAKDYSVSGYDLTIEKEPKWESVSLPQ